MTMRAARIAGVTIGLALGGTAAIPVAAAHPSEPGVVSYAVLGKGSVGNIVGGPMGWESVFTQPAQGEWVDLPVCNNWADIGLPEVYNDPDLASFNGAVTQTSASDQAHYAKQAVGVFATADAANRGLAAGFDKNAVGIDALGVRRLLKSEYFIITDPLIILAGALLLDRLSDLRFHRWAFPIAAGLFGLHLVISQAEPVKYALQRRGPESVCEWNQHYMPLLPLPWCAAARS